MAVVLGWAVAPAPACRRLLVAGSSHSLARLPGQFETQSIDLVVVMIVFGVGDKVLMSSIRKGPNKQSKQAGKQA
jgi:hypothetical protein